MKTNFYLMIFSLVIFSACKKSDDESAATACFSVDMTESTDSTHSFLFDQCPPAYDASYWDFGDGQYSSNPNPSHQFNHYGTYNVKLTVTNSAAQTNSVTHTITIGHYSLDKIVYRQLSHSTFIPPIYIVSDICSPVNEITDTVSQSLLPFTHQVPDNAAYDLSDSCTFYYSDTDGIVNSMFSTVIYPSLIVNKQYNVARPTSQDTVKFTIYFKIAPR